MEAFVAFTDKTDVRELGATMESWDIDDIEPVAIKCEEKKFELMRRIAAENMAQGDYLLVDVGCVPKSTATIRHARKRLYPKSGEHVGMVGSNGVRICRHKVVDKWPNKQTDSYDAEHAQAYQLKGYKVIEWPLFKRLGVS